MIVYCVCGCGRAGGVVLMTFMTLRNVVLAMTFIHRLCSRNYQCNVISTFIVHAVLSGVCSSFVVVVAFCLFVFYGRSS